MLTEYYEDFYEENKKEYYNEISDETGHIILPETGDELIDKWERELAQGLTPDLEEGMTQGARELAEKEKKKAVKKHIYNKAMGDGFSESYSHTSVSSPEEGTPEGDVQFKKLIEYAESGGMDGLDQVVVSRMLSSLTSTQAQKIIKKMKQG